MSVESNKRKMELKNQIITLSLSYDGKDLDKLTIAQLQEVLELHKRMNELIKKPSQKT
jgi:hypothetical protein